MKDALPSWLRTLFIAISDAPMTNFRILNSEILTYLTAAFLFVAALMQVTIDVGVLGWWLGFLAAKGGWAMGGAWAKRATYKPSPPASQDIEDVAATTPTPPPEKVLTKPDADKAAKALEAKQQELKGEKGVE
jgi:hypothetical protein